jgi:hypothetical protein
MIGRAFNQIPKLLVDGFDAGDRIAIYKYTLPKIFGIRPGRALLSLCEKRFDIHDDIDFFGTEVNQLANLAFGGFTPSPSTSGGSGARELLTMEPVITPPPGGPNGPVPSPGSHCLGDTALPPLRPPSRQNDGRWTKEEVERLEAAIRALGPDASAEALSKAVGTRSARQCSDRFSARSTAALRPTSSLGRPHPNGCATGRWSEAEISRLEAAVNHLGGFGSPADLSAHLGDRTASQVADKVECLIKAGRINRTGPSSYRIV